MEKYKILRFAYQNEENTVIVPYGTKFFKIDEFKTKAEWNGKKDLESCTYVAILPYSKKNWNILNNDKQTFSLLKYNLCDEYIVLKLDQVCPLEELPITETQPSIEHPTYCKWYNLRHKMEDWCKSYIKVNKMESDMFDCTIVYRKNWYNEDCEVNTISRELIETNFLIRDGLFNERTVKSSKEEFEKNFEEVLTKIKE